MKKIISIFIITYISIFSLAAQTFTVNGIVYKVTSPTEPYTVELTVVEPSCSDSICIPEKVEYNGNFYLLTSIGEEAFYNNIDLFSIILPNSVRYIGEKAFSGCRNLKYISLPNSIPVIREMAFLYCTNLKSIVIPNSVKIIEDNAFYGCEKLDSLIIPNSVTKIGERAFADCIGLKSIELPESNISIYENTFDGCTQLKTDKIPKSVTTIKLEKPIKPQKSIKPKKQKKHQPIYFQDDFLGIKTAYHYDGKSGFEIGGFYTRLASSFAGDKNRSFGFNVSADFYKGGLVNFPKLTIAMHYFRDQYVCFSGFKFSYSRYSDRNLSLSGSAFTPEIGLTFGGFFNLSYGYHFFTGEDFGLSKSQFSVALYIPIGGSGAPWGYAP